MGFLLLIVVIVAIGAIALGIWVGRSTGEVSSVRSYEKAVQALSSFSEDRHLISSSTVSSSTGSSSDADDQGRPLVTPQVDGHRIESDVVEGHVQYVDDDISNRRLISRVVGSDVVVSYGAQQQLRAMELSRVSNRSLLVDSDVSADIHSRVSSERTRGELDPDVRDPIAHDAGGLPRHAHSRFALGAESNSRLTSVVGLLLVVLLFFEGITVAFITQLLAWHIIIGLIIIPPLTLKLGSVLWRFAHYYLGDQRYRRAGPPPPLLRMLGPPLFVLTVVLMVSGVALWLGGPKDRSMFVIHQVTFFAWIFLIAAHVLGHLGQAVRLGLADSGFSFSGRLADTVRGGGKRIAIATLSLLLGLGFGFYGKAITNNWGRLPTPIHAHATQHSLVTGARSTNLASGR